MKSARIDLSQYLLKAMATGERKSTSATTVFTAKHSAVANCSPRLHAILLGHTQTERSPPLSDHYSLAFRPGRVVI